MLKNLPPGGKSLHDKRKLSRIRITLPIQARGTSAEGIQFEEMSQLIDANGDGALFLLRQDLDKGMRLKLSVQLPRSIQKTAAPKPVYELEVVAARIHATEDSGTREVAVRFCSAAAPSKSEDAQD